MDLLDKLDILNEIIRYLIFLINNLVYKISSISKYRQISHSLHVSLRYFIDEMVRI